MAALLWTAEFETGIPVIDQQHRQLFALINKLCDAMGQFKGAEEVGAILDELKDYIDYHFSTEEKALEQCGYPELAQHRQQHRYFVSQIAEYCTNPQSMGLKTSMDLLQFLGEWIRIHIQSEDKKYVSAMKESGK